MKALKSPKGIEVNLAHVKKRSNYVNNVAVATVVSLKKQGFTQ